MMLSVMLPNNSQIQNEMINYTEKIQVSNTHVQMTHDPYNGCNSQAFRQQNLSVTITATAAASTQSSYHQY